MFHQSGSSSMAERFRISNQRWQGKREHLHSSIGWVDLLLLKECTMELECPHKTEKQWMTFEFQTFILNSWIWVSMRVNCYQTDVPVVQSRPSQLSTQWRRKDPHVFSQTPSLKQGSVKIYLCITYQLCTVVHPSCLHSDRERIPMCFHKLLHWNKGRPNIHLYLKINLHIVQNFIMQSFDTLLVWFPLNSCCRDNWT